ncbi:MAG TPA: MarR family transcriptional regulator [Chloroflexota bacterium]|nr:MarR family transcriptional regulator [Chloroflexota bacterium]
MSTDTGAKAIPTETGTGETSTDQSKAWRAGRGRAREPQDAREALVALMAEMQRLSAQALYCGAAPEWLKLELTTAQLKLLAWLTAVGEQPMSQVARVLGIGLPAATNLVDKLVEAGMVTREHSTADRRVVLVRPSPAGEAQIARLHQTGQAYLEHILDHVRDEDMAVLEAGLRVLIEAIRRATAAGAARSERGGGALTGLDGGGGAMKR